ncbi:MAG: hypothetical protein WHV67_06840, partial [Thermoanaerobaculia bacterium]
MNEKIMQYLKDFALKLQKEMESSPSLEEFLSRLEEDGFDGQLDVELILSNQNKKEQNLPLKTKISFKNDIKNKAQFILTIEDLDFLRSLGIE